MSDAQTNAGKGNGNSEAVAAALAVLAPLATIDPRGQKRQVAKVVDGHTEYDEEFSGVYGLHRVGGPKEISADDLKLAAETVARGPKATPEQCRKALLPFARVPEDPRVEKDDAPLFVLPAAGGGQVTLTNRVIRAVRAAYEALL